MLKDPIKIHYCKTCNCERIDKNVTNDKKEIFYIAEKFWSTKETKNYLTHIFIEKNKNNKQQNADKQLSSLLLTNKMRNIRSKIINYFKEYTWNTDKSVYVRNNLKKMTTICFCNDILNQNFLTSNAGILLIGNHKIILDIAILFETNIKNIEYERLYCIKISDIALLKDDDIHYILNMFIKSQEYQKLKNLNLYALIGKSKIDHKYSFAFGKREWNLSQSENSLDCAFRELYEEFNIQISKKVYCDSCKYKFPKYIYSTGITIYLIYLKNSNMIFHRESKTIYIN